MKQVGNRFSGRSSGGPLNESLIGAIGPDNQRGVMLDDDGEYDFTVVDASTLNVCYRHSYSTGRVVGCYQLKKQ